MNINEFAEKVLEEVQRDFGPACKAQLKEVQKNNGVLLHGLLALPQGKHVAPTIYLESFYEAYADGMPFGEVVDGILQVLREEAPKSNVDMSFFKSFEKVRGRICYRLAGKESNRELLEQIPYVDFLDLAICFYYAYSGETLGDGAILIYNSHLKQWGITIRELMKLAEENTPALFPGRLTPLGEILRAAGGGAELGSANPLMVLTNARRSNGAACMLYQGLLEQIAAARGDGFYIIPSSVHEVLILDKGTDMNPAEIRDMIREVNGRYVTAEEVLSDNLYFYDFVSKSVRAVF